ncbi:hypothetical protein PG996_003433 [Apiospora saccharicola]|uniref:F-box domain-containing protein n=1 Tax=Apiospora saccharicola TaxID=335842 RepID=A0ABR1W1B5_9PEZI
MPELPLEIWNNIAAALQLQPMQLGKYAPDSTFLARRACLRNLCLTSQKLLAAAQPWLYESVILYHNRDEPYKGPESLVQLLRSLAASPSLRRHIQHLACAFNLWPTRHDMKQPHDAVLHEWQAARSLFEDLPPPEKRLFDQAALFEPPAAQAQAQASQTQAPAPAPAPVQAQAQAPHPRFFRVVDYTEHLNESQEPQKLLAILLCFAPKLQSLLIQGNSNSALPARPFSDLLEYFLMRGGVDQSPVLPLLSTIRLQPDRGAPPVFWAGLQVCQDILAHLPSLSRLDLWKTSYTMNSPPKWASRLEDIHVANDNDVGGILGLMEQATALRTLRIDCINAGPRYARPSTPQGDLNQALHQHAATLVSLRLTGMTFNLQRQGISLSSLPQLRRVEELEIEHQQLVSPGLSSGLVRVPDLLPPNLRRLKLLFLHGCNDHFDDFLLTFPLDLEVARSQGCFKRLQEIQLEVFSAAAQNDPKQMAAIDNMQVAVIGQGCICTYALNRGDWNADNVEPWALDLDEAW